MDDVSPGPEVLLEVGRVTIAGGLSPASGVNPDLPRSKLERGGQPTRLPPSGLTGWSASGSSRIGIGYRHGFTDWPTTELSPVKAVDLPAEGRSPRSVTCSAFRL